MLLLGGGYQDGRGVRQLVQDMLLMLTAGFEDDLGNELDLVWKHQLSGDVSLALGYAAFDAGDYFTANNAGANSPDVTYTWIECQR